MNREEKIVVLKEINEVVTTGLTHNIVEIS